VLNFIAFQLKGDLNYPNRNHRDGLGGAPMQSLIESAANKAGVPLEVLDLVGRDFIGQIAEDLPSLLLPPIMSTLKQVYQQNGLDWMQEDILSVQNHFLVLRQMYGPAGDEKFQKPDYRNLILP
jgi:hypothetical protein